MTLEFGGKTELAKKRRSGGRTRGKKGRGSLVTCSFCGKLVPREKAKKVTSTVSVVDFRIRKELRQKGALIPTTKVLKYACISCAVHRGIVKIRSKDERKR